MEKEKKSIRIKLNLTQEEHEAYKAKAEELGLSVSAFCVEAINLSMGKMRKIDPKLITVEPIDVYTEDIMEGLNKIGTIAAKFNRLLFTLSMKENVASYELERLDKLAKELAAVEQEFNNNMTAAYDERLKVKKAIIKNIDKRVKELLEKEGASVSEIM